MLTDKGEEKYGKGKGGWWGGDDHGRDKEEHEKTMGDRVVAAAFWMIFIGVALWIVYNAFLGWRNGPDAGGVAGGNRPGWGGGGGGWGGNDDPPPPYDYDPNQPSNPYNKRSYGGTGNWRPGFWSGALGGAAAGYAANQWGNNSSRWGNSGGGWDNGEGSSGSSSGSSSFSSTRHESTGFGSTSRR